VQQSASKSAATTARTTFFSWEGSERVQPREDIPTTSYRALVTEMRVFYEGVGWGAAIRKFSAADPASIGTSTGQSSFGE
jgi:hypothetical protein